MLRVTERAGFFRKHREFVASEMTLNRGGQPSTLRKRSRERELQQRGLPRHCGLELAARSHGERSGVTLDFYSNKAIDENLKSTYNAL